MRKIALWDSERYLRIIYKVFLSKIGLVIEFWEKLWCAILSNFIVSNLSTWELPKIKRTLLRHLAIVEVNWPWPTDSQFPTLTLFNCCFFYFEFLESFVQNLMWWGIEMTIRVAPHEGPSYWWSQSTVNSLLWLIHVLKLAPKVSHRESRAVFWNYIVMDGGEVMTRPDLQKLGDTRM